MSNKLYIFIAALIGVISGFVTIHSPLAHSWTSTIFWILVGLIIIYFSSNRRTAIYAGAIFGFINTASWLLSGFQGTTAQLPGILAVILITGILGAVAGALGAALFYWFFRNRSYHSDASEIAKDKDGNNVML